MAFKLHFRTAYRPICCLATIGLLAISCDKSYDLDNISGDMQLFQNGLTAPVGNTEKFKLTDFITQTEQFVERNGQYVILYSGNTQSSITIPELMLDPIKPSIANSYIDFLASIESYPEIKATLDALGYTGGAFPESDLLNVNSASSPIAQTTEHFTFTMNDVAPEVVNVQSFTPAQGSMITLTLHANGLPQSISTITFDFRLKAPSQLVITPMQNDIICDSEGYYIIKRKISCTNGAFTEEVPFQLNKAEFNPAAENINGNISVDAELAYGGTISIQEPFNLSGWIPQMELAVSFESNALEAAEATVRVEKKLDPIDFTQELNDLPDLFDDPTTCLDLQSVMIDMSINNESPASLETDIALQSIFTDGSSSPEIKTAQPIFVNANATQRVALTNNSEYAGTVGYIANLNELMYKVPRQINVEASPHMPPTDMTVGMGAEYNVGINYDIVIPATFGDEVDLHYEGSFDDLGSELSDMSDMTSSIVLKGKATSTIPLDLDMVTIPVDESDAEIRGLDIQPIKLQANATTDLSIEIKQTEANALQRLKKLKYVITATSAQGGDLRPDQYLQFTNLTISLPGGVTIQ